MSVSDRSGGSSGSVMGAIDEQEFVIADTESDGAWLTIDAQDAPELDGWR
jgi:hypothetical protein